MVLRWYSAPKFRVAFVAVAVGSLGLVTLTPSVATAADPSPTDVRAFVGGKDIALLWNPAAGTAPKQYKVYRNGNLVGTVSPTNLNSSGTTQRFYDAAVTKGTTYQYQISSVNGAGEESAPTAAISVTHPANPVPVPTITIPSNADAKVLPTLRTAKTLLETWYPKIVTTLGNPTGTPTAFTLTSLAPSSANVGFTVGTNGTTLYVNSVWGADKSVVQPNDGFVHEAVHIAQATTFKRVPNWAQEGEADYVKYYVYGSAVTGVPTGFTYLAGYENFGYFVNWVSTTYNKPNFARDLHLMAAGGWNPAFFKTQTGLSFGELWTAMGGKAAGTPTAMKNGASGFCADVVSSGESAGTPTQIYSCNGTPAQQWTFVPDSQTSSQGAIRTNNGYAFGGGQQMCLDVKGSGTANGTVVQMYTCNNSGAQKWVLQTNGSVKNVHSGKCLQPAGGSKTQKARLQISSCTGASVQNWNVRPPQQMQNLSTSAFCLDSANGHPADGGLGWVWNNNCDYTTDQQFTFMQTAPGSADGSYRLYGGAYCLDVLSSGTADGTSVIVAPCNGTVAQKWIRQGDGTLKNPNSGKCLQPVNGSTALGAFMEIRTCSTTNIQKWKFATL